MRRLPRRGLHLRLPGDATRRDADAVGRLGLPLRPGLHLHVGRILRLPLTRCRRGRRRDRAAPRPHSGMFECLRQGSSIFLAASIASERQILRRVSCGWITSSM